MRGNAASGNIIAMLCLETLGCYFEQPGTQRMSLHGWLLPREGNFLALVANRRSKHLLLDVTDQAGWDVVGDCRDFMREIEDSSSSRREYEANQRAALDRMEKLRALKLAHNASDQKSDT
jgi:hypothetical protein